MNNETTKLQNETLALQLQNTKAQNDSIVLQNVREVRQLKDRALQIAQNNKVEAEDLLITAQRYFDFLSSSE